MDVGLGWRSERRGGLLPIGADKLGLADRSLSAGELSRSEGGGSTEVLSEDSQAL